MKAKNKDIFEYLPIKTKREILQLDKLVGRGIPIALYSAQIEKARNRAARELRRELHEIIFTGIAGHPLEVYTG